MQKQTLKIIQMPKIIKGPKVKEINHKSDKPDPSEKSKEQKETKVIFQSSGIVSNLSKTLLQKHSAVKHVSEFEEKLIPDKLSRTAKMEPKQVI